ncbi:MAG: hypothetical protein JWL72_1217 [Ilumatobacteraceae bacterium]|nr:hypothetical protein [Ilumatobacteraceae bacterium]MCU1387879.1 hypothetical protein [Ilumatobacteraceae bacterium]
MASGPPSLPAPTGQQPVTSDAQITTILSAVEQQLTRYFGAAAARADAVQQAGEAGRAELITHFQQQIDTLRSELDRSREANETYERALQAAIEDRLTEFAAGQHWRFGDLEGRLEKVSQNLTIGLPAQLEQAAVPLQERFDRTTSVLAVRIDELQKAARGFDEQSAALVNHVNESNAAITRRMDDTSRAFGEHINDRTAAVAQRVDEALGAMRNHVADHVTQFGRRADESDSRVVERLLAMEERINEQTGARVAALEATVGRISTGMDEAIVALSHRVIELENDQLAALGRLEQIAEAVSKVDDAAVTQLREQMSAAVGESMLVRIELERVATSTGDQVDKINARIGELAAQIADTELDVSTAIQLERLEEIERALSELDPEQFLRKTELPKPPGSAMAAPSMAPPYGASNGAPHGGPNGAPPAPAEANLSSW